MSGYLDLTTTHLTLLQGTAALNCSAGVIGGASVGQTKDTVLYGFIIGLHAATAATLTVSGAFHDSSNTVQPVTFNGQIALDTPFWFPQPILNEFGPMTFTPSVAGIIMVFTRAYVGPEGI